MASGWIGPEPAWNEDDGSWASSLERRQRKRTELNDVLSFYRALGVLLAGAAALLIWTELSALASPAPSTALTAAFALELLKFGSGALSHARALWGALGSLCWTLTAVFFGPDFAQQGAEGLGSPCSVRGAQHVADCALACATAPLAGPGLPRGNQDEPAGTGRPKGGGQALVDPRSREQATCTLLPQA